jgi:NADH:ubiquinone oxidoreductase subunit 2 (subunit N)
MWDDVNRLGPELALMVAAGAILLVDLVLRDRDRVWLPFAALAGLAASAGWMVGLILAGEEGVAFSGALSVDNFSIFFTFLFIGVAGLVVIASADYVAASSTRRSSGRCCCWRRPACFCSPAPAT